MEEECSPSMEPHADETKPEPLTVIEQDEVMSPQPEVVAANQAMKGTCDGSRWETDERGGAQICLPSLPQQKSPACLSPCLLSP